MQTTSQIIVTLDTLPRDVIREIVSYLDAGYIVSLSQVNQFLRRILVGDNYLWLRRLEYGLKVPISAETRQNPFGMMIKRIRTHRCAHCGIMEVSYQRPFMNSFFNKVFCNECKTRSIYALINAGTAKRTYFLNEDDLLPLRMISVENPHYKSASPVRLYSRHQVRAISEQKLALKGITREERLRQQRVESERQKEAYKKAIESRRTKLFKALRDHSMPCLENCVLVRNFINGRWRNKTEGIRWTVDDVVEHFRVVHQTEM